MNKINFFALIIGVALCCVGCRQAPKPESAEELAKHMSPVSQDLLNLANQGDAEAQFHLGWMYANGLKVPRNLVKAAELYRKAAEQGHAEAQYNLGIMYKYGIGVNEDQDQSVLLLKKAAEQGNVDAQFTMGIRYSNAPEVSDSVALDIVEQCRKAAEEGHPEAQFYLATLYKLGLGVSLDLEQAKEWYQKSADQGVGIAQDMLNRLN